MRVAREGALKSDSASPRLLGPQTWARGCPGDVMCRVAVSVPCHGAGGHPTPLHRHEGSVLRLRGRDRAARPGVPCPRPAASPPGLSRRGHRGGLALQNRLGEVPQDHHRLQPPGRSPRHGPCLLHVIAGVPAGPGHPCDLWGLWAPGDEALHSLPPGALNVRRRHGCHLPGVQQPLREAEAGAGGVGTDSCGGSCGDQ